MKLIFFIVFLPVQIFCFGILESGASSITSPKEREPESKTYTADFDGDKKTDSLTIMRNIKIGELKKEVIICNPFDDRKPTEIEPIALLIELSKSSKSYLIIDSSYFSTPSWISGEFGIKIINKGEKQYRLWKKCIKNLNGAAVVLGTEAGIDILLYWDKNEFKVFWPDEEP